MAGQALNTSVVAAVRRYCAAHPRAADTVDGVHRWWLGDVRCAVADLRAVLDHLVGRGELERRTLADGTEIYCAVSA